MKLNHLSGPKLTETMERCERLRACCAEPGKGWDEDARIYMLDSVLWMLELVADELIRRDELCNS